MNFPLHDIERSCGKPPGGIRDIGLIDPDDITSLEPLVFKSGKRIWLYQQNRFTGLLKSKQTDNSPHGDTLDYTLTAFVRGLRGEVDLLVHRLLNRRIHILVTYWSGEQKMMRYARALTDHDSGRYPGSRIGYTLTATTRHIIPATLLGGTITLPNIDTAMTIQISTTGSTYSYTVPAGRWLENIFVKSDSDQAVSVGRSSGAGDITDALPMTAGEYTLITGTLLYAETDTTIYFSGLEGSNSIKILLLG